VKGGDHMEPAKPEDAILELDNFVPYYIKAIANRLAQAASRFYKQEFGIGLNEWSCLATLGKEEEISASRICEMSGFDKAIVSRSVNALQAKGLIESSPVRDHNRRRLIRFTPAGRALYVDIRRLALEREARLLEGFSSRDRAMLLDFLRLMLGNANNLVGQPAAGAELSDKPRTGE
jgi:DNA-binding MarR family transcriptional regulator